MERGSGRCKTGVLDIGFAFDCARSCAGRTLRRFRQYPRNVEINRCGNGKGTVDVLQYSAARDGGLREWRGYRGKYVDHWNLRSGTESGVRGNRKSHAGFGRKAAARRQSLDLQHRGTESRYGETGLGISGLAARYT